MKKLLFTLLLYITIIVTSFANDLTVLDLIKNTPQLDLTDIYVFQSITPGKTVFILDYNPQSHKDSLNNSSSQGIYRICIGANEHFTKGIAPTFTFKDNKIQLYIANTAEPKNSDKGIFIGEGQVNKQLVFKNGIKIWAGTVYNLFIGNTPGIANFREKANQGIYDLSTFDITEKSNTFSLAPSSVIVLEIPNEMLPKQLYYYAITATKINGKWITVNKVAQVLFSHLYTFNDEQAIQYFNSNHHFDKNLEKMVYETILKYVKVAGLQKRPEAYTKKVVKQIYPDVLTYEVGTDAEYSMQNINGRPLHADAINVALALLVGSEVPIDDNVGINLDMFQDKFPYVVPIDSSYSNSSVDVIKVTTNDINLNFNETNWNSLDEGVGNSSHLSVTTWTILGVIFLLIVIGFITRKKNN
jgi:hypothetical protein